MIVEQWIGAGWLVVDDEGTMPNDPEKKVPMKTLIFEDPNTKRRVTMAFPLEVATEIGRQLQAEDSKAASGIAVVRNMPDMRLLGAKG